MLPVDEYTERQKDLKGFKLLNYRFPNKLLIRSTIGMTVLRNESTEPKMVTKGNIQYVSNEECIIRVFFNSAHSSRDYYNKLVQAVKKLDLYTDNTIDDVLQDIAIYRWRLDV